MSEEKKIDLEGLGEQELEDALKAQDQPPVEVKDEKVPNVEPTEKKDEELPPAEKLEEKEPAKPPEEEPPPEPPQSKAKGFRQTIKDQKRQIREEREARIKAELETLKLRAEANKPLSDEELDLLIENDKEAAKNYLKNQAAHPQITEQIQQKERELGMAAQEQALQEFQEADVRFQAELAGIKLDDYPEGLTPEAQIELEKAMNTPEYQKVATAIRARIAASGGVLPTFDDIMKEHLYLNKDKILEDHGKRERQKAAETTLTNINQAGKNRSPLSDADTDREGLPVIDYEKITPADQVNWGETEYAAYDKYLQGKRSAG